MSPHRPPVVPPRNMFTAGIIAPHILNRMTRRSMGSLGESYAKLGRWTVITTTRAEHRDLKTIMAGVDTSVDISVHLSSPLFKTHNHPAALNFARHWKDSNRISS